MIVRHAMQPFLFVAIALVVARWSTPVVGVAGSFILFLFAQRSLQTNVHDLSHRLFSGRSSKVNDAVGNYLAAGWIGSNVGAYRSVHFEHHRKNGSADDPEFIDMSVIKAAGGLTRHCLRYMFGFELFRLVRKYYGPDMSGTKAGEASERPSGPKLIVGALAQNVHVLAAQALMLAMCVVVANAWYLYLVWAYLLATWSPLTSGLRFLVEHPGSTDLTVTTPSWSLERALFAPLGFNYHFEHHAWPGVPPYRLKAAHRQLAKAGFFDRHPEFKGTTFTRGLIDRTR